MYSWLRRNLTRSNTNNTNEKNHNLGISQNASKTNQNKAGHVKSKEKEDEYYGVTDQLIEFVKTFTLDTFKTFPLHDEESGETESGFGGVRVDLSEWQQQHAVIILSKVKDLSQLRYKLCPGHLKERQFWRIYFSLVKSYVFEYELRAIQVEKLRKMAMEDERSSDTNGIELEMTESKYASSTVAPP